MSSVLLTMIGSQCRNRNPPAMVFEYASPWRNGKITLLLRLTRASWWHAKGTRLQKQVYRERTVLYMMVITRGSLLPSSWPLCLCVAFPHPPRVALRKAACDNSLFHFFFWGQTAQIFEYMYCAIQYHNWHGHITLANNFTMRTDGVDFCPFDLHRGQLLSAPYLPLRALYETMQPGFCYFSCVVWSSFKGLS